MALSFGLYRDDPSCSYRKQQSIPHLWGELYLQTCLPGPGSYSEIKKTSVFNIAYICYKQQTQIDLK